MLVFRYLWTSKWHIRVAVVTKDNFSTSRKVGPHSGPSSRLFKGLTVSATTCAGVLDELELQAIDLEEINKTF